MTVSIQQIIESIEQADTQINLELLTAEVKLTDIGADSLDIMNIFVELDDVVGFMVPDDDMEGLNSVQAIHDYFVSKA
jgi:acyl carrier protein